MFLAEWSGRRVAAYALTWLVGFPLMMSVVITVGAVSELRGYARSARSTATRPVVAMTDPRHAIPHVDTAYYGQGVVVDTALVAGHHRQLDPAGQLVMLPMQPSDISVSVSTEPVPAFYLWSWLLPPALLVAAWAWSRRSRPEPG